MSLFHANNEPTFCGEDQTTPWSESVSNEQAALGFDWTATCPVLVSTDSLWDMRVCSLWKSRNAGWVFAGTFDELPNANVGPGLFNELEAAGIEAFNHGLDQPSDIYDHTNTVST